MTRRLLLISYHFGPGCETGGLRWNAITTYLAHSGWEVDVIAAVRAGAEQPYEWVPGVRVIPVAVPDWLGDLVAATGRVVPRWVRPAERASYPVAEVHSKPPAAGTSKSNRQQGIRHRLYSRVMGNVGALTRWSAQVGWARHAVKAGIVLARSRAPQVVAVSSPPHATQLAGVWLSRALAIPFLSDFRDPWLFGELDDIQSAAVDRRLGQLAQARTFATATKVILNTGWAVRAASEHDRRLTERIATVPNGYDPRAGIGRPDPEVFRVAFVGWLYDFMDPEPVLAACGRLRAREGLESLRVEFVGTSPMAAGVSLQELARIHGLEACFEHRSRVSRTEALHVQERAAVLVAFDYPGPLRIPMKFYDAMQMYGDPLLIGRRESALGDAAARTGVSVCPPNDAAAIDAVLNRALRRWHAHDYNTPIDAAGLFAREGTSRQMLEQLESMLP